MMVNQTKRFRRLKPFGLLKAHEDRPIQKGQDGSVTEPKTATENGTLKLGAKAP
jgi:hypothetical protein